MIYCQICLQPDTRPNIVFVNGKCPACIFYLGSMNWDWDVRVETLKKVISEKVTGSVGQYDCILGVSGGKDSTRLALWARDFLGLKPLLVSVSYPPEQITERGVSNLDNLIELGFDIYISSPSPILWKAMMRKAFLESANWAKTTELALFAGVPQIAIELGVKLILWGENPALQLGALETMGTEGWDGNQLRKMNTLSGMDKGWISLEGFSESNFLPYYYPEESEFQSHDIQIIFLGWAMRTWGLLENGLAATLDGFSGRIDSALNTADLVGLSSVDEDWVTLNQMIKYYKYGFGRATDYVNEWIRKGRLTRSEAVEIVEKYDGACSDSYINSFCLYIGIDVTEFWNVVSVNTNRELFDVHNNMRPTKKFSVGN